MSSQTTIIKRALALAEEIDQVIVSITAEADKAGLEGPFIRNTISDIRETAQADKGYAPVKEAIKGRIRKAQLWSAILERAFSTVEMLEVQHQRRAQFSEEWWQQQRSKLDEVFTHNPAQGRRAWLQTYVQALVAWELGVCEKLVSEPKVFVGYENEIPRQAFKDGTKALVEERYADALEMLDYLVGESSDSSEELAVSAEQRAALQVLKGRSYLYKTNEPDKALAQFIMARELAPDAGLPSAALGCYYHSQNFPDQAVSLAQRAIELAPDLPDGYVALGIWAEGEDRLDEADEFYGKAIDRVWNDKDPYQAINRLLAPVSSRLLIELGKRLLNEGYPEAALVVCNKSFELGADDSGQYTEPTAYELKGDILKALGRPQEEVCESYFEAGREYYRRNEPVQASKLLTQAHEANPKNLPTCWFLVDALRLSSFSSGASFPDPEIIKDALVVWESAIKDALPDVEYSWAYVSRALINERLHDDDRVLLWWEAVAYLERAILLLEQDASRWSLLGRFYRYLTLEPNALRTTEKALSYDPKEVSTLEERSAILSNLGRFDEAAKILDSMLVDNPSSTSNHWVFAVKAYVLLHQENYKDAATIIDDVIKARPEEIWYREIRALCKSQLGDTSGSKEDYEAILVYRDELAYDYPDYQSSFGWALYKLGKVEEAGEIFNNLTNDPLLAGSAYRNLGFCNLRQSEQLAGEDKLRKLKEGRRNLYRGIGLAINTREIDDLLKLDLSDLEKSPDIWAEDEQHHSSLRRIRRQAEKRRCRLEQPQSAEEELSKVIRKLSGEQATESHAWLAAQAGLARMRFETGKWDEAGKIYQQLLERPERFPEARIGLENCIGKLQAEGVRYLKENNGDESFRLLQQALLFEQHLARPAKLTEMQQQVGDALLKAGHPEQAIAYFSEVLTHLINVVASIAVKKIKAIGPYAPLIWKGVDWLIQKSANVLEQSKLRTIGEAKAEEREKQADVQSRLGYAMFSLGDVAAARTLFIEALHTYRECGLEPGRLLGEVCLSLLRDAQSYWMLDEEWQAFAKETEDEELRRELEAARTTLVFYFDKMYQLDGRAGESFSRLPTTTPIALVIGTEIIPQDTSPDGSLFGKYIPEMRARVLDEMGVQLPGVSVREENLEPAKAYIFMLDEVPILMGSAEMQMRYCPEPPEKLQELGIDPERLTLAPHPLTRQPGCWVPSDYWEALAARKIELWDDPLIFVIYHLEAFLRQHLADFMGVQETETRLDIWGQNESGAALIKSALPDAAARLRFVRVLRALLEEQVPLTRWEDILQAVLENGLPGEDIYEAVRAVRLRLKSLLTGNRSERLKSLKLPGEIESDIQRWLHHENGKTFLALPLQAAQEIIAAVNELISGADKIDVLVTCGSDIRPFIRQLVQLSFPDLMVLSQEEQHEVLPVSALRQMEGARADVQQSS